MTRLRLAGLALAAASLVGGTLVFEAVHNPAEARVKSHKKITKLECESGELIQKLGRKYYCVDAVRAVAVANRKAGGPIEFDVTVKAGLPSSQAPTPRHIGVQEVVLAEIEATGTAANGKTQIVMQCEAGETRTSGAIIIKPQPFALQEAYAVRAGEEGADILGQVIPGSDNLEISGISEADPILYVTPTLYIFRIDDETGFHLTVDGLNNQCRWIGRLHPLAAPVDMFPNGTDPIGAWYRVSDGQLANVGNPAPF